MRKNWGSACGEWGDRTERSAAGAWEGSEEEEEEQA